MRWNNKVQVEITSHDQFHDDYKSGEKGFIDGYIRAGRSGAPHAVVVVEDRIVMVPLNCLKVLLDEK
jgi:hypothetical protein